MGPRRLRPDAQARQGQVVKTKYRSRFDIIALILKGAVEGSAKTRLMYLAYVSYNQLDDALAFAAFLASSCDVMLVCCADSDSLET